MLTSNDEQQFESEGRGSRAKTRGETAEAIRREKRHIAEASLQPGASVAVVAKAYGVHRCRPFWSKILLVVTYLYLWPEWRPHQAAVVRWRWPVFVVEAVRTWTVRVA